MNPSFSNISQSTFVKLKTENRSKIIFSHKWFLLFKVPLIMLMRVEVSIFSDPFRFSYLFVA